MILFIKIVLYAVLHFLPAILSVLNLCVEKNRIFPKNPVFLFCSTHKIKLDKALQIHAFAQQQEMRISHIKNI